MKRKTKLHGTKKKPERKRKAEAAPYKYERAIEHARRVDRQRRGTTATRLRLASLMSLMSWRQ
jgi:hypothetical protein